MGLRLEMTLIIRPIATYAWPLFEISLSHQINLILLMILSYTNQGNYRSDLKSHLNQ